MFQVLLNAIQRVCLTRTGPGATLERGLTREEKQQETLEAEQEAAERERLVPVPSTSLPCGPLSPNPIPVTDPTLFKIRVEDLLSMGADSLPALAKVRASLVVSFTHSSFVGNSRKWKRWTMTKRPILSGPSCHVTVVLPSRTMTHAAPSAKTT